MNNTFNVSDKSWQELIETQKIYESAIDGSNCVLWDYDMRKDRIKLSDKFIDMTGINLTEIFTPRKSIIKIVHKNDYRSIIKKFSEHLDGVSLVFQSEFRIIKPNSEIVWLMCRGKVFKDENGLPYRAAGSITDTSEMKNYQEQIKKLAFYDSLTGLINKNLFTENIKILIEKCNKTAKSFALFFIDLDNFKNLNDEYGHAFGDVVLKQVAERLNSISRDKLQISRRGGDEFIILLSDCDKCEDASNYAKTMLEVISKDFVVEGKEVNITASIGIAIYSRDGIGLDEIMKSADAAMYRAKQSGKNNYLLFDEKLNKCETRLQIQKSLKQGLLNNEMKLYYQPQVNITEGRTTSLEVLLRWHRNNGDIIYPGDFIHVAEETGLIVELGEWVLNEACLQNVKLINALNEPLKVCVNVSMLQVYEKDFFLKVRKALELSNLRPDLLELEITESILADSFDDVITTLKNIRSLGVNIALDDFGKGYSSLNYLRCLPINTLKVDKSFIDDIKGVDDDVNLTSSIITMAHKLNLSVVAEGVENSMQLEYLRKNNCDMFQGFYFSKALRFEDIIEFMADQG